MPSTAHAPFGGSKESGFGQEGGRQSVEEYLDTKYVSLEGVADLRVLYSLESMRSHIAA